ncbi:MAG: hypothetical protein J6386_04395 [Candidatus Synoicihabitans palmerolidicus]|nr:hypothetical protein [Candidatus Synoicihabitans palmerolidicus]
MELATKGTEPRRVTLPAAAHRFELLTLPDYTALILFDQPKNRAIVWTLQADSLCTNWHGSPLVQLFHWWSSAHPLQVLHAGCVGTTDGAVLIVGKGGSGKSTTALLSLEYGLQYVSDDYTLVGSEPAPTAYCLFSTGKLPRDHFPRFPELARIAEDPCLDPFEKPVIFAHEHFAPQISLSLPLKAILLPCITDQAHTDHTAMSGVDTLRAMAPSTLLQLQSSPQHELRAMVALTKKIPGFRLNLSRNFYKIAPAVSQLLNTL